MLEEERILPVRVKIVSRRNRVLPVDARGLEIEEMTAHLI
jgi:hypothetical protein